MTDLALSVLEMTLIAALVTGIVLPLRWGARKLQLPAGLCVALWLVVMARMVVPVGMATSTLSFLRWSSPAVERQVSELSQAVQPENSVSHETAPAPVPEPLPVHNSAAVPQGTVHASAGVSAPAEQPAFRWTQTLPWLWLAGVLVSWGYTVASWLLLRRRLRTAVRRENLAGKIYWESPWVDSPFVFGLFRPRVYVPLGLEGDSLDWVLRHEQAHVRLGHHWMKLLFFLALGVHWYNPVLWLAWFLFCRDLEVHCDEHVLKAAPGGQKAYSIALLTLAVHRRGPLLPPGFGETGVKERIKRALGYRKPKGLAVLLAVVLGVLAVCCLGCDPVYAPLPEDTPVLTVQSDISSQQREVQQADGPSKMFPAPAWSTGDDDSPNWITLLQVEPTLELYLDCEQAPDQVVCTEYLYNEDSGEWMTPLTLNGPSGLNGVDGQYWMLLSRRADSVGTGMEWRLLSVQFIWDNGRDSRALTYPVLLRLPSVKAEDPMRTPLILASSERLEPGEDTYLEYNNFVSIVHPRGRSCSYFLTRTLNGTRDFVSGGDVSAESHGSFGFRMTPIGEGSARYQEQEQHYTLTYTWEDGSEDVYEFVIHGLLPRAEVDLEAQRIKPSLAEDWQDIGALLPAPAEWKDQDLAGRNKMTSMEGMPVQFVEFSNARDGWAVCTVGRGAGVADTYVYRTNDGGNTWVETGHPTAEGTVWYPSAFYTDPWDSSFAMLAYGTHSGSPVCRTRDNGASWEVLDLNKPEDARECIAIHSERELVFSSGSGTYYTFYSLYADAGQWEMVSHLEDPEHIPLWELPPIRWHSYGDDEEQVDTTSYMDAPIQPFGAVKGTDIALYALRMRTEEDEQEPALLLRSGEHLELLPISNWEAPWRGSAQMELRDYDGDGVEELSLLLYEGHGTGVSVYGLYILEPQGEGYRLAASMPGLELLQTLDAARYGVPENAEVGQIVSFAPNGDRFTLTVGMCSTDAPYTATYTGDLVGEVSYDGTDLVIGDMEYTPGYMG